MGRSSFSLPGRSNRRRRVAIALNYPPPEGPAKSEIEVPPVVKEPIVVPKAFDPSRPGPSALYQRLQHDEPMTWIFSGDSNYCSAFRSSETFPRLVADWTKTEFGRTNEIFVNATYAHAHLEHVKVQMKDRFATFSPDVVTLVCGFADCESGVEKCEEFERSLIGIIKQIQNFEAMPVICTPPYSEYEEDSAEQIDRLIYLEAIRGCVAEYSGILIDHWDHWEQHPERDSFWDAKRNAPTVAGILEMQKLYLKELGIDHPKTLVGESDVATTEAINS